MTSSSRSALAQYRNVGAVGNVESADSHKLVQLLYDGLAESLSTARGAIERADVTTKTAAISKAAQKPTTVPPICTPMSSVNCCS